MPYVDRNGQVKRQKLMKPGCGLKCHKRCHDNINFEQRETLFHEFWQLGNLQSQREYIARHVKKTAVGVTKKSIKHRKNQILKYEFMVDGKTVHVCKTFFMHTLSVSDRMILSTMNKLTTDGRLLTEARKCPDVRRVAVNIRNDVKSHIGKFPTVSSHYCRKNSSREYLSPGLSLSKMYQLYVDECQQTGETTAKKWLYYDIFQK